MQNLDPREEKANDIILKTMDKYVEEDLLESYKILQKLLQNLSENEFEQKYKTFKKSNTTIKSKVLKIPEVLEILRILGYKEQDKDTLIWPDKEKDISLITNMSEDLKMFINLIEAKLTNRKLEELAQKDPEKKAFLEEQKRKENIRKEDERRTRELMDIHKQETQSNWTKNVDSNAKDTKFGATECRFEPKDSQRGG